MLRTRHQLVTWALQYYRIPYLSFPPSSLYLPSSPPPSPPAPTSPFTTSKWGGYSTYLQPEESPLFADWILAAKLLPDEAIHFQSLIVGLVGSEDLSENVMEILDLND